MSFYINSRIKDKETLSILEKHLKNFDEIVLPPTEIKVDCLIAERGFVLIPEKANCFKIPNAASNVEISLINEQIEFKYENISYRILIPKR